MILYKETKKLYQGKYQHRIVLVCPGVHVFRGNNLDNAFKKLSELTVTTETDRRFRYTVVNSQEDIDYLFDVYTQLSSMSDYTLRVEHPWLSIYTNNEADILMIKNINQLRVREIHSPAVDLNINEIVSSLPYDYKVTVRVKNETYDAFVDWANQFDTIKLTNKCIDALNNTNYYLSGESYFYISGDKTLTMAKLHLGGAIRRIEKIIRRDVTV